jgi:hypothetical protein
MTFSNIYEHMKTTNGILIASLCLILSACSKSSSKTSETNAQIKYEVRAFEVSSWSGIYLDGSDAATQIQSSSSDWSITFTNQIPSSRYLQMQVTGIVPMNQYNAVTVISIIYVNGSIVKSDTTTGYVGQFTPAYASYLLQ